LRGAQGSPIARLRAAREAWGGVEWAEYAETLGIRTDRLWGCDRAL
jgi:hypothetical protein